MVDHGVNLVKLAEVLIASVHNHAQLAVSFNVFERFRTRCVAPQPFLALVVDGDWHGVYSRVTGVGAKIFEGLVLTPFEVI